MFLLKVSKQSLVNGLKKAELTEKLIQFKTAVESNDFPCAEDKNACTYCDYKDICNYIVKKENEEE